jgi:sensor domain CHASE-containing protein
MKSINAPIAAFTMAVILCSYCFSSIRTARQNAQTQASTGASLQRSVPSERKDESWVQRALEESRLQNGGKEK